MQNADCLISAETILPIAPHNIVLQNHAIVITDGRIVALLPTEQAKEAYCAAEVLHFPNHVLMPGLVNAHTHTPMNLLRGFADDLDLMTWLNNYIWPAEQAMINETSTYVGTQLAAAEMIRGGTTCFNDHYFFPSASAKAASEAGIRACIGLWLGNVPTLWGKDEADYVRRATETLEQDWQHPLISWSIAVHDTYTISETGLRAAYELSNAHHLPVHMHLHETQKAIDIELEKNGCRSIETIEKAGLLNDRFIGVHMVHLNDNDLAMVRDSGCHVVTSPESNCKLGSGIPGLKKLNEYTNNIAIGTDGCASNNDLDMFAELRQVCLLAKGVANDARAIPASRGLEMATMGGARAMQLADEIGSLEAGKAADIIAVDMNHLFTYPSYDPMSSLVYSANRLQVSDVWVNGERLLRDGVHTRCEPQQIIRSCEEYVAQVRSQSHTANSQH